MRVDAEQLLTADIEPLIRRVVSVADIDHNGHMNSARYFAEHIAACRLKLSELGVTEEYVSERRMSTFAAEHHVRYFSEMKSGEVLALYVHVLERAEKVLHLRSYLVNETSGEIANVLEVVSVHVNLVDRRAIAFPTDLLEAIDHARTQTPAYTQDLRTCLTLRRDKQVSTG